MDEATIPRGVFERALRGIDAFERGAVGWSSDGGWVVAGDNGTLYRVTPREETCTCSDSKMRGVVCKHLFAVEVARAKTAVCSGCGQRFPHRELVELTEDNHDNLTHFNGDHLCAECCDGAGVEH